MERDALLVRLRAHRTAVGGDCAERAGFRIVAFRSAVSLFLTLGSGPFVLHNAWGGFSGKMVDATHMSGVLFYSDGSGYFGDDGIAQTVVISR